MIKEVEQLENEIDKLYEANTTMENSQKLAHYKKMLSNIENLERDLACLKVPDPDTESELDDSETDIESKQYYNVDKCINKIVPITFVSGGVMNAPNTQNKTTPHSNSHNKFLEAPQTQTTHDTSTSNTDKTTDHNDIMTKQLTSNVTDTDTEEDKPRGATYDFDYKTTIENAKLSRLENQHTFQAALRLVTRLMHPKGAKVCYPIAEQTDRLVLKSINVPTDGPGLCDILRKACSRRGESFNLEQVYQDMARAYGRVYFDPTLAGPKCMVYTHYP